MLISYHRTRSSISVPPTNTTPSTTDRKGKKRAAREPTPDADPTEGRASSSKRVKQTPNYELRSKGDEPATSSTSDGKGKGKAPPKKKNMPKKAA